MDLAYLDPPFYSGRNFGAFDDRWKTREAYLAFMRDRLAALYRVLSPTGSLYLHCDDSTSAYLRLSLDSVFGLPSGTDECWAGLQNVIAWKRTSAHGGTTRAYGRVTDTIFFYAKGVTHCWNPSAEEFGDLWTDIRPLNSNSKERTGYPTQKPVALLRRILAASSNPGDIVLDPFCGSGTALVAAAELGRRWLGMDRSPEAVRIARRRLAVPVLP